jgi:cell division protein FtsB
LVENDERKDYNSVIFNLQQLLNNKQILYIQEKNRRIILENKYEQLQKKYEQLNKENVFLRDQLNDLKQMILNQNDIRKNNFIFNGNMISNVIWKYGILLLIPMYFLMKDTI